MGIKENLKMLRKAKNLKQTEVGKMINKKPLTIGRYENGSIAPNFIVLEELAKIYDVSVDDILTDVKYVEGKKYNLEDIKKLFLDQKINNFNYNINNDLQNIINTHSEANNSLVQYTIFKDDKELEKYKDLKDILNITVWNFFIDFLSKILENADKNDKTVLEVLKQIGEVFINGKYELTAEQRNRLLNDIKQYLDFLISKEKK